MLKSYIHLIKYADHIGLVSLLNDKVEGDGPVLDFFFNWCKTFKFVLNTKLRNPGNFSCFPQQSSTKSRFRQTMSEVLDCHLNWDYWAGLISTMVRQRLHFLKKLFCFVFFRVNYSMLVMSYSAFIESILTFGNVCWFGNAIEAKKKSLRSTVTTASKLLGTTLQRMEKIYMFRGRQTRL